MSGSRSSRVARLPLVLLGIMSVLTFAGPFVLWWILSGGRAGGWPPDRPVEWAAFVGTAGLVAVLMIALLTLGVANVRAMNREVEKGRARVEP